MYVVAKNDTDCHERQRCRAGDERFAAIGATVLSDRIQVRSGTVTPPNPALPRIAYDRMMTKPKNRSPEMLSASMPYGARWVMSDG